MAYPVYEGNGGIGYNNRAPTSGVEVPYPSTVNANDILVAVVYIYGTSTWDTPSGWTKILEVGTSSHQLCVLWARASGSESGTVTFTGSGTFSRNMFGIMYRFSGCVTSGSPLDDSDSTYGNGTTITIPEMTSVGSERLAVHASGIEQLTTLYDDATDYSQASTDQYNGTYDVTFGLYTLQVASSGSVASDSYTKSDVISDNWRSSVLLLIPAGSAGYANKVIGVSGVGKVNGVASANIAKVIGA